MADVPEWLPQREPGAQLPDQCGDFPRPWPLPGSDVSGWFCPSDQWLPKQETGSGWPGSDLDAAGGDERDDKDAD